jgi:CorA-like Mg2+ transporter protein
MKIVELILTLLAIASTHCVGRDHAAPTAIAGNYDVNFEFMPELGWRDGYGVVLGVIVMVCSGLWFTFKGWGFFPSSPGRMDDSDRIHVGLKHSNVPLNPYDTVAGVLRHARRRTPSTRAAQILRDLT